jgi:hypothetical protein
MLPSLRYNFRARANYIQGQPVVIAFEIENLSSTDVWVLKWYTPLEGIKGKIFKVYCDGVEIPYEGPMMKRGNPGPADYAHVPAGGTAGADFDLSQAYSLPACQECRVKFKGRIHDAVSDEPHPSRTADQHTSLEISGDDALFSISHA